MIDLWAVSVVLAIMNNDTISIHEQTFVWTCVFKFFRYPSKNEFANQNFKSLIFCFQSDNTVLHSSQQSMRLPVFLHRHQPLVLHAFIILNQIIQMKQNSTFYKYKCNNSKQKFCQKKKILPEKNPIIHKIYVTLWLSKI